MVSGGEIGRGFKHHAQAIGLIDIPSRKCRDHALARGRLPGPLDATTHCEPIPTPTHSR